MKVHPFSQFAISALLLAIAYVTMYGCGTAHGQSVTLAWNVDTDPTVTGYTVWWASLNDSTVPLTTQNVGNVTKATTSPLAATTYYFFVTRSLMGRSQSRFRFQPLWRRLRQAHSPSAPTFGPL
jgi:hypothetical protein